jgi:hypothetical protein
MTHIIRAAPQPMPTRIVPSPTAVGYICRISRWHQAKAAAGRRLRRRRNHPASRELSHKGDRRPLSQG